MIFHIVLIYSEFFTVLFFISKIYFSSLFTIGNVECPITCTKVTCTGHGPIVSFEPSILDFGETNLLEDKQITFNLKNDSPIPAKFTLAIVRILTLLYFNLLKYLKFIL